MHCLSTWDQLLKGLIAYSVNKATITMCILTKCLKYDEYFSSIYNSIR